MQGSKLSAASSKARSNRGLSAMFCREFKIPWGSRNCVLITTRAPYLNNSATISTDGFSFEATYSASTGRSAGPSSLRITKFGSAPRSSSMDRISSRFGMLSAHATCSGEPMIGDVALTSAPKCKIALHQLRHKLENVCHFDEINFFQNTSKSH